MSHLLHVSRLQSRAMKRKGNVPLMLEYHVSEETAPYLVSSSSSVMWITEPHPGPLVKAAVRQMTLGEFFREVVEAVLAMGRQQQWGNVHPLTEDGLQAAIEHVEFYDLEPVELLIPRAHPRDNLPDEESDTDVQGDGDELERVVEPADLMPPDLRPIIESAGVPFRPCSWVPDDTIIVVPKDRTFVGVVSKVTPKHLAGVVHNAARGIAVLRRMDELAGGALPDADPE